MISSEACGEKGPFAAQLGVPLRLGVLPSGNRSFTEYFIPPLNIHWAPRASFAVKMFRSAAWWPSCHHHFVMRTVLQSVRYGCRMLSKTPALTVVVAITLTLGERIHPENSSGAV
jgi:hypothetical protein